MIRQCANKKSIKHPDIRCPLKATHGEFCFRHYKNPRRFESVKGACAADELVSSSFSPTAEAAVKTIQRAWKLQGALKRVGRHGLGLFNRDASQNDTEVTTMEDITSIPAMYYYSYRDSEGKLWSFDIRSLIGIASHSTAIENPYTREKLGEPALVRFHELVGWLRRRKFSTQFLEEGEMTETQLWNQRVLDVFLKLDKLGFTTNLDWFHDLKRNQLARFYAEIYYLWKYLPLKKEQKEIIVSDGVFKGTPENVISKSHDIRWWQEEVLSIIDAFCSQGKDVSSRTSGAMYIMRCLCVVGDKYADAYSWILG